MSRARRLEIALGLALCSCGHEEAAIEAHAIAPRAPAAVPALRVTWLGTAGVRIDDGWTALLVDPFVTRPVLGAVALGTRIAPDAEEIEARVDRTDVAAVLVSHSHYDHAMDAPRLAEQAGAELVGSPSTAALGHAAGLDPATVRIVEPGVPLRYGDFRITFLESRHGAVLAGRVPFPGEIDEGVALPMRARDYRMGGAYGIVIEHPAGTIVHHASAAWIDGMYEGVHADVVLLGLAGHRDPGEYVQAVVDATGARRIVPIHWDSFFRPLSRPLRALRSADVSGFFAAIERDRPDLRIETLPLLRPRVLLEVTDRDRPGPPPRE